MLKPSLQLKLGQSLTMTPQLQQAIRLLQLPVLDLNAQIQDALEENIMLEMEDLPDVPRTSGESSVEIETIKAEDSWQSQSTERIQDGGYPQPCLSCSMSHSPASIRFQSSTSNVLSNTYASAILAFSSLTIMSGKLSEFAVEPIY